MDVIIKNQKCTLQETGLFGREGEIYLVDKFKDKLVKIYEPDRQTAFIQRKVTAIINKFRYLDLGGVENFISYPESPVYDAEFKMFRGFMMKYFNNHSSLFNNRYDLNQLSYRNEGIDDNKAIVIFSTLYAYLEVLHRAGLILGDVNPANILLDKSLMPYIVDFDSVQLGTYYSNTNRIAYIDPSVRIDGYGRKKYFIYTMNSDVYAMTIIFYEFLVGIHPYFFQTTLPTDTEFKKKNALSLIDYLENNTSKTDKFEFKIFENSAFTASCERLNEIKVNHKEVYAFFKTVFSDGNRHYFGNKKYKISAINSIESAENTIVDLIPQAKQDPEELEIFMKQFRVNLF
jgi:serine/threonine protein kinase